MSGPEDGGPHHQHRTKKAWIPDSRRLNDVAGTSTPYARPGSGVGGIRSHRSHSDRSTDAQPEPPPSRTSKIRVPRRYEELINWLSWSVAFLRSSTGTITHATRYSTTPVPPSAARTTITSRTMFASMPLYAAKPPHTPAILRSVVDRVSRREPRRSDWPAGRSVRFMTSGSSW